jgi:GrpB-like predicted nucleotidyltransferase (UPF0157 family)
MLKKYSFRKYSNKYPKIFEAEKLFLIRVLPNIFGLEHVGSTSVFGMGGKGIIDILISFKRKKDMDFAKLVLIKNRYEVMSELKDRISLRIYRGFLFRNHFHVHLTLIGSKTWKQSIKFRDKLKNNSALAREYADIKKKAVIISKGEGKIYRELKEAFIKRHSK